MDADKQILKLSFKLQEKEQKIEELEVEIDRLKEEHQSVVRALKFQAWKTNIKMIVLEGNIKARDLKIVQLNEALDRFYYNPKHE